MYLRRGNLLGLLLTRLTAKVVFTPLVQFFVMKLCMYQCCFNKIDVTINHFIYQCYSCFCLCNIVYNFFINPK